MEPRHGRLSTVHVDQGGSAKAGLAPSAKSACRPMGSLIKRSSRRWFFEELIPVCLPFARRTYASAPKRKKRKTG